MKKIIQLISRFFPKEAAKPLGRWNIDYCTKKTDVKIDLSNEDHCGPCGQYVIEKKLNKENEKT
uniref:Uncharacterized protein n=1 Tax=viral metagenome TaxID=1070528 RepID=A0A6C0JKJ8_9ZZZZ